MWSWSEHVAERATAASFLHWRIQDPEPTVTEPEYSETSDGPGASGTDGGLTPRDGDAIADAYDYARMPDAGLALAGV
ncbi:hypothetical protein VMT65_17295 [Nocardia sp. CDC153]|uniref:hypothetical protein n=1 Tax=Nocardia sp. CDC153 TaxID=3112167 RepID=UPI002DBAFBE7|nr:hypothetical protein [Nocardia sp. CDC153]MEC3954798.1 hypothetical protein [Nocardia sp. CDC153]